MANETIEDSANPQPSLSSNTKQLQSVIQHNFPSTEKLYMTSSEGNYVTDCTARLLHVEVQNNEQASSLHNYNNENYDKFDVNSSIITIILDRTILYAQGGGQPSDHGTIRLSTTTTTTDQEEEVVENVFISVHVTKVILERETGIVRHYGTIYEVDRREPTITETTTPKQVVVQPPRNDENKCCSDDDVNHAKSSSKDQHNLKLGLYLLQTFHQQQNDLTNKMKVLFHDIVQIFVDKTTRQLHSECHTVGHIVDAATERCGYNLIAGKGYHFLDGPYVEYIGTIGNNNGKNNTSKDGIMKELQTAFQDIIQESIETKIHIVSQDVAMELCKNNQDDCDMSIYADSITGLVRIVTIANLSCPCGGTHMSNTSQLQNWDIISIKTKKGCVRVRYGQKK